MSRRSLSSRVSAPSSSSLNFTQSRARSRRAASLAGAAAAVALGASTASAQLVYEPFDYGTDAETGTAANYANTTGTPDFRGYTNPTNGLSWFSSLNGAANDDRIFAGGSMTQVSGLAGFAGNRAGTDTRNVNTKQPRLGITPGAFTASGTTVYYSLTLQFTDLGNITATPAILGGFNNTAGTQAGSSNTVGTRLMVRQDPVNLTSYNIGVANQAGTPTIQWQADGTSSSGFKQWTTADELFVVGGYTINGNTSGTDDVHSMWINPSSSDFGAATAPAPTMSVTGGDIAAAGVQSFLLRTQNVNSPFGIRYDEIRADTTWAQVTPAAGSTFTAASSTDWSNAGSWNAGGVPNAARSFAYFNGAGGTVNVDSNHTAGTLTFRSANAYTVAGTGGTLTLNGDTGGSATINVQPVNNGTTAAAVPVSHEISAPLSLATNLVVNSGVSQTITASGGVTGTANITKNGPGTLVLDGGVDIAGNVVGTNGILVLNGTNNYTGTTSFIGSGTVATGAAFTTNILAIDGDAALGAVPGSPTNNIFLSKPSAGLTFRFDADTTLHANRTIVIAQTGGGNGPTWDTGPNDVIVNGNITASVGANIMKLAGTGTLFLRGDNSTNSGGAYVGAIFINAGTVNVVADNNLGRTLTGSGVASGIQLNGGTGVLQFGASFPWDGRQITFGGTGGTIDTNGFDQTISGTVTGGGTFGKTGAGTLTMTGNHTHTGPVVVNGGTLTVSGPSGLGGTTGALTVNNPNTGAGNDVVLNLPTGLATARGPLSGTIATPSSGTNTATINNGGQLLTINQTAAGSYDGNIAGTGGFTLGNLSTNKLTLTGTPTYTGPTTVEAGTLALVNGFKNGNSLTVTGGKAEVSATSPDTFNPPTTVPAGTNAAGSLVNALSITGTGQLDLNNNDMIVDHNGTLDIADIRDLIASGYNFGGQDGPGIISTTAALTDPFTFTLGYADNASLPLPYGTTIGLGTLFAGFDVDDTAALIKFTWVGDVTLDGVFDFQDLSIFNGNYDAGATTGRVWTDGDLNYDGTIDFQDLSLFNGTYDPSKPSLPEPGGLGLLLAGAGLSGLRLRRRR